jgi:hypothetical protein
MRLHRKTRILLATLVAALGFALLAQTRDREPEPRPELGLMGTLPIYWGEAGDLADLLNGGEAHWARVRLEASYSLRPLDTLSDQSLAGIRQVLLAQPRALTPAENVALDAWVRAGGNLLLFADPMLTGESQFGIGDRRRPQDVIVLSPILRHWGLELDFDLDTPEGFDTVTASGTTIPVNLPGRFSSTGGATPCSLEAENILARCRIGSGSVVVLADAALLDLHHPHPAAASALSGLLEQSFGKAGK